jgi:polysaccharide biosynthesis/export protein
MFGRRAIERRGSVRGFMNRISSFGRVCGLVLCLGALPACSTVSSGLDRSASGVEIRDTLPPPDPQQLPRREFRFGPFDSLVVDVMNSPELRRETLIDGAGNINLPLVGTVRAAGLTPDELSRTIADGLRGRFIRDPYVSVSVREAASQILTVDGEVRQPGRYQVIGDMTLQEAVASARGLNEDAQMSEVVIFRRIEGRRMAALFSLADIRQGRSPDPEVYSGDVVVVGTSRARRMWRDLAQLAPLFNVFTPLIYVFGNN